MKLRTYIEENKITAAEFATRLTQRGVDVSEFGVRKWVTGERIPRREAMSAILEETNGQVSPADFYNPSTQDAAE